MSDNEYLLLDEPEARLTLDDIGISPEAIQADDAALVLMLGGAKRAVRQLFNDGALSGDQVGERNSYIDELLHPETGEQARADALEHTLGLGPTQESRELTRIAAKNRRLTLLSERLVSTTERTLELLSKPENYEGPDRMNVAFLDFREKSDGQLWPFISELRVEGGQIVAASETDAALMTIEEPGVPQQLKDLFSFIESTGFAFGPNDRIRACIGQEGDVRFFGSPEDDTSNKPELIRGEDGGVLTTRLEDIDSNSGIPGWYTLRVFESAQERGTYIRGFEVYSPLAPEYLDRTSQLYKARLVATGMIYPIDFDDEFGTSTRAARFQSDADTPNLVGVQHATLPYVEQRFPKCLSTILSPEQAARIYIHGKFEELTAETGERGNLLEGDGFLVRRGNSNKYMITTAPFMVATGV